MDTIFARVAGLDVHQKFITVAYVAAWKPGNSSPRSGLLNHDQGPLGVGRLPRSARCDTRGYGIDRRPLEAGLEHPGGTVHPAFGEPRHVKQVPSRKSDVSDAEWIAQLLQCGLLQGSFVPKRELRELRDLTRYRAQLASEQTAANRIHKVLEDANIKLGAVASDILGKSGRAMLWALNRGERDPDKLATLALGRLRAKIPELKLALEGHFSEHHRYLVEHLLGHLDELERRIEEISQRIGERLPSILDDERLRRLDAIAGVNRTTIENVVAEIVADMSQFPDEHHLSSWAGICPGNECPKR